MTDNPETFASVEGLVEEFSAHCAHDINNFLTGILGNLELMQNRVRRNGTQEYDGYLEGARNAAGRAVLFAQRLLAFSGRDEQVPQAVPVNRLIADMMAAQQEQAGGAGSAGTAGSIAMALAAPAGDVVCDPAQLEGALLELLANAREATAQAGDVRITTALDGQWLRIVVADSGVGMAPEILARATEPFFSTGPNGTGKGLGLAVVARFARQSGGRLELSSQPGSGTAAALILPCAP